MVWVVRAIATSRCRDRSPGQAGPCRTGRMRRPSIKALSQPAISALPRPARGSLWRRISRACDVPQRPDSPLFPDAAQRQSWDDVVTRELAAAHDRVIAGPVTPRIDQAAFRAELAAFDFQTPQDIATLLSWTITQLEHG